ncbi:helix-turn-helix domain-containing protein [Rhodospirillales bacterium]|jgi:transcriptional regulator with XRE-family HTH domain|nr:helix-turn-helix domain-containing protein [Rhodospirillales bacterium]
MATERLINAEDIDVSVGRRLRDRRTLLGLSQSALAQSVELTFQQIQKYERGANRISACRLYQFSCLLDVDFDYFFGAMLNIDDCHDLMPAGTEDPARMREVLTLVRAYYSIDDAGVRQSVFELAKALADEK